MKQTLRRLSQLVVLSLALGAGLLGVGSAAQAATVGTPSITYTGVSNPPTADKPQSKLWWNDGSWWANMWKTGSGWSIYRLDRGTATWVDTGVRSDIRGTTSSDTLWDGTHLYIASHVVTAGDSAAGQQARLYRYSYSAGTYTLDSGFPATISDNSSESLTIARDSRGVIWATWTQVSGTGTTSTTSTVFVNSSLPGGNGWGEPFVVPGAVDPNPAPDDLSAIVAFNGDEIGIMWTDQAIGTAFWSTHTDGDDPRAASSWRHREAIRGNRLVDDHMNIKALQSDAAGRVYAVVKTGHSSAATDPTLAQELLVVFKPGTGVFEQTTISRTGDCVTRPQIMLDTENNLVRVFHTAPSTSVIGCPSVGAAGSIYEKTADMDNPVFENGRGALVIEDANSPNLNNVTSTKQSVNAATGLVVMATDHIARRYWFSDRSLGTVDPPPDTPPTASFTATPTSGTAPLAVNYTDTSTGSPTTWAWNFGDGSTSSTQNPSHTYTAAGTYTATLTAANAAGSTSSTKTITVGQGSARSISGPADIVAAGSDGVLWNYPADGNGGLKPPVKIGAGWGGLKNGFVTDWNQDGVFDVIAQWKDGRMSYYAGKAAGGLAAGQVIGSGWSSFHVTVGRWRKADTYPSVVAYDAAGVLWHYPHTTGTTFGSRTKIGTGWNGLYLTMADYNRDGAQDILAKRSDGSLRLYRSTGSGTFQSGTHPVIGSGWNSINSITKLEGYQGTGTYGLMARFTDGRLAYYPILNGTWGTRTIEGSGWGPYSIFR